MNEARNSGGLLSEKHFTKIQCGLRPRGGFLGRVRPRPHDSVLFTFQIVFKIESVHESVVL